MNRLPIKLIGHGTHLPERVVEYAELEAELGLPAGHYFRTLGVQRRHWASPEDTTASLGAAALRKALDKAGLELDELDMLINANASYDHPLPATASLIQREFKSNSERATPHSTSHIPHSDLPCLNVHSSCISFLNALEMASCLIACGNYRRIAIVSSEIASRSISPSQPHTYGLFGDGAAAVIVEATNEAHEISGFRFRTYGEGAFLTYIPGGGNVRHPKDGLAEHETNFHMDGLSVLRFTTRKVKAFVKEYELEVGRCISSFQLIIPHQASGVSLAFFKREFDVADRVHDIIANHGNCVAASIPFALCDAIDSGRLRRGDEALLMGTASGVTIGAGWIRY